jgi:uncharacterized protein YjbI with pentapeptide repeats
MKIITISDSDYDKVKDVLNKASDVPEKKKGVTIYKHDGSVLVETDKETMKEAVVENKADLREANLRGADLREANLRGANLCGANLCGADLREVDLCEADLCGANLCGANLCEANLCEANLRGANLCEVDLRGVNLCEADLREAELDSAKFYGKGGTTKIKKNQVDDFFKALGIIVVD